MKKTVLQIFSLVTTKYTPRYKVLKMNIISPCDNKDVAEVLAAFIDCIKDDASTSTDSGLHKSYFLTSQMISVIAGTTIFRSKSK